jgi:hypothetical protein
MAFKHENRKENLQEGELEYTIAEVNAMDPVLARQMYYPDASDSDIGALYDMIEVMKTTLEAEGITLDFGKDQAILDQRQAVKARFPKKA